MMASGHFMSNTNVSHLKETTDIKFIFTSHLNYHVIEKLFSTIRRRGEFKDNQSAKEFCHAFRMVMVAQLIQPADSANFSSESDKFVLILQSLSNRKC